MFRGKIFSLMMAWILALTLAPVSVIAGDSVNTPDSEPAASDPTANTDVTTLDPKTDNGNEFTDKKDGEVPSGRSSEPEQKKPTTQPTEETLNIRHQRIADNGSLVFHASLPNAEKASGKWAFVFDGREKIRTNDRTSARAKYFSLPEGYEAGKEYEVKVRYEGIADGEPAVAKATYKFKLTLLEWGAVCTEKGIKFNTKLDGAEKVRGNWTFLILGEDVKVTDNTGKVSGAEQQHTVTQQKLTEEGVSPGEYEVHVDFQGIADGAKTHLFGLDSLYLDEDAPCLQQNRPPGNGNHGDGDGDDTNPDNGETPDDGKTEQPDSKDGTDSKVDHGGNLPDTSGNELTIMLIGGGIALAGLILFLIRKRFPS
ncbi:LPXTG-motif cell wall-anchored protein [Melghirimyces profundicolus]|uniref:LPXTG-motif cell wall-anchored protein n=1 Tax=Melghirimyces profundicolus TaxID=1242148 RepID=A0A2T6C4X5_9BACL|nr:LPXTG cell wall anchor domain-containing protein [Melghirimyces profundicolus]PTX63337.1 LPXTG-motif cell wall-anchored protein [Melghirimyces profundicolus]